MKVFDIITEARPRPSPPPSTNPSITIDRSGNIIDAATGAAVDPGEFLNKLNPAAAKQMKAAVNSIWLKSTAYLYLGWMFSAVPAIGVTALQWAYQMSCINYLWDRGQIVGSGSYKAGEVAQQMRTSLTKEYGAQLLTVLVGLGSLKLTQFLASVTGMDSVKNALGYITGVGDGSIKQRLAKLTSAIVIQTIFFVVINTDWARNKLVYLIMSAFPNLYSSVADVVQGGGAMIPASMSNTINKVLDDASTGAEQGARNVAQKIPGVNKVVEPTAKPSTYNDRTSKGDERPLTPAEKEQYKKAAQDLN